MKKSFVLSLVMIAAGVADADVAVKGPDGRLEFRLRAENGAPQWSAAYDGRSVAEWSPLGLETEYGDFTKGVKLGEAKKGRFRDAYSLPQGKRSKVKVEMNMAVVPLLADNAKLGFEVRVGKNDLAFRYFVEKATTVRREATGFAFASGAKMFATQQSKPMTGFAQTKPSYEETYVYDAELGTKSGSGEGWTFPMLMRLPGDGGAKDLWALVSETGTDGNYCGCRLADWENGCFRVAFPMPGEARGKGSVEPKCAAKTSTPWRTLTVGDSLAPIVETTIAYDVVKPVVPAPKKPYEFGRGSWSWIVWDDASMNAADQRKFIDLAAAMGWEHILIDAFWDRIPAEEFDALLAYAKEKKVAVYLWYNSNGDWNDAPQTPKDRFVTRESTEKEMAWLESKGVRGVKVDFWGGDKQFVIAKYCELFEIAHTGDCPWLHAAARMGEDVSELRGRGGAPRKREREVLRLGNGLYAAVGRDASVLPQRRGGRGVRSGVPEQISARGQQVGREEDYDGRLRARNVRHIPESGAELRADAEQPDGRAAREHRVHEEGSDRLGRDALRRGISREVRGHRAPQRKDVVCRWCCG